MQTKILIIKLGYSETLDSEIGKVVSLGDVLRTTCILWALKEQFPDSHITWLVSQEAEPLLNGNRLIDRVLVWDSFVPFQLMREKYDLLINLEKILGLCALTDMIDAWVKYGFRFDTSSGAYHAYEKGQHFISYLNSKKSGSAKGYWQQILIELLGVEWKGQKYAIGYKPKTEVCFDIGFNFEVGTKWPSKGMPLHLWKVLESKIVAKGYSVSWQQGQKNLYDYMDWIHSCRYIITSDSLGLHLAFAFNKKVIGLFGPTDANEVYFYTGGKLLRSPLACEYMPCIETKCKTGANCMAYMDIDEIVATVEQLLHETPSEQ